MSRPRKMRTSPVPPQPQDHLLPCPLAYAFPVPRVPPPGAGCPLAAPWSPSPADRARQGLLDDPGLSNKEIALRYRTLPSIVKAARAELTGYGLLPASPYPQRHFPRHKALPPPPRELTQGACVGLDPAPWTDPATPADAITAALTCAGCHVAGACWEWSLSLPDADRSTYAGRGASDRERERLRRAGKPTPLRLTTAGKNAARDRRRATARQAGEATATGGAA